MENLTSGNQRNSPQDAYHAHDLMGKLEDVAVRIVQPIIGLAVVATNIALFYFHKRRANQSKITFLLLSNLTFSDVLFGGNFLIQFILVTGKMSHPELSTFSTHGVVTVSPRIRIH